MTPITSLDHLDIYVSDLLRDGQRITDGPHKVTVSRAEYERWLAELNAEPSPAVTIERAGPHRLMSTAGKIG